MEKPLFPLAVGLVLISVVIGSKNREENAKGLFCVLFSALMVVAGALAIARQLV